MTTYLVENATNQPLIPGAFITGTSVGRHPRTGRVAFRSTWDGVYVGVVPSEHTGEPVHLFRQGHINGVAQSSHAFPAETLVAPDAAALPRTARRVIAAAESVGYAVSTKVTDRVSDDRGGYMTVTAVVAVDSLGRERVHATYHGTRYVGGVHTLADGRYALLGLADLLTATVVNA